MSRSALIYTALAAIAIVAVALFALRDPAQPIPATLENRAELENLREGTMKKLAFHTAPKPVSTAEYETESGAKATLADHLGRYVLLNFWATWCAPCRKEMPMLATLQDEFGGESFEVLTIATGRNNPAQIKKFFDDIGTSNLPLHRDPLLGAGARHGGARPARDRHPLARGARNRPHDRGRRMGLGQRESDHHHPPGQRRLTGGPRRVAPAMAALPAWLSTKARTLPDSPVLW